MEDILLNNVHITSTYFSEKQIVFNYWTGRKKLQEEDFKEAMIIVADKVLTLNVKGILVDTRNFNFTIPPEVQKWYDTEIVPKHLKAGIKKMAFLLPQEIFAQVSIEQTMEEETAQEQNTQYFESYEEAESWLME